MTKQTVNDWAKGRTQFPRPEHLFPLARYLGVEPEWLGTGIGQKYPDKRAPPDISEATKILTSMPEKDRVPYIEIIKRAKAA